MITVYTVKNNMGDVLVKGHESHGTFEMFLCDANCPHKLEDFCKRYCKQLSFIETPVKFGYRVCELCRGNAELKIKEYYEGIKMKCNKCNGSGTCKLRRL